MGKKAQGKNYKRISLGGKSQSARTRLCERARTKWDAGWQGISTHRIPADTGRVTIVASVFFFCGFCNEAQFLGY